MKHYHGIEHERNLNQGKTKKQIEDSSKLHVAGATVILLIVIVLFIVGFINVL